MAPRRATIATYLGVGDGHWIESVLADGKLVKLEDNSLWRVSPLDEITTSLWLPTTELTVIEGDEFEYPYKLVNTEDDEVVDAKLLSQ